MGPDPTVIDGRFELLEPLGSGGMGTVWRARDVLLHREVALKEVCSGGSGSGNDTARLQRERAMREARALARIAHPNVVALHHIVDPQPPERPWIVMELVRGCSLADRIDEGPMPLPAVATIGRGLLAGLGAAHRVGVLHRDIKPANVLLREDGSPVLTDFGIAALHDAGGLTTTGNLVGSVDYVAPERLSGHEGDPASDLWSLGLVLFVAAEGYHPLHRDTTAATLAAIMQGVIPAPKRSGRLKPVLQAMLAVEPEDRPSIEQLQQMLAGRIDAESLAPAKVPVSQVAQRASPSGSSTPSGAVPATPKLGARHLASKRHRVESATVSPGTVAVLAAVAAVVASAVGAVSFYVERSGTSHPSPAVATRTTVVGRPPAGRPGNAAPPAAAAADLLTPNNIRAAIGELEKASGGEEFISATFYQNYIRVGAPVHDQPNLIDEYQYRNGSVRRTGGAERNGAATIRLSSIDWDILPGLLATANEQLGVPKPTIHYVVVDTRAPANENRPAILVYVGDQYGTAYLIANVDGATIKTVPRDH